MTTKVAGAMFALGSLALAACSESSGGSSEQASTSIPGTRTVEIEMRDIAFDPDQVDVRAGETVRFVFTNVGEATHDAFIGDEDAQAEHEMEMQQAPVPEHGSEHSGDTEGGITVEPGGQGEITHTFADGEQLIMGCHQPGHYDGGMKISLNPT